MVYFYFGGDEQGWSSFTSALTVITEWTNRYAVLGWDEWLDFDGVKQSSTITQPLMMIHSDGSALPDNARKFFAHAKGPKQLVWMDGEHTQFYDTEPQISHALDAVTSHFERTLATPTETAARAKAALAGTQEFFDALESNDIPRFLKVWADDGVQLMPYAPAGFPNRLDGKAAIEKQYGPLPTEYTGMKYPVSSIRSTDDPNVVIVEFEGRIGLKSGGRYDNRYVGMFAFDSNGKLIQYTEYFDPFVLLDGYPGAKLMSVEGPRSLIEALPRLADGRDWAGLQTLFTKDVYSDYTSVNGGKAGSVSAAALVTEWKAGMEQYDRTTHTFGPSTIKITADSATGTFSGQSTQTYTNGTNNARWSCGGDYEFGFLHTPRGWKVNSVQFHKTWEEGKKLDA